MAAKDLQSPPSYQAATASKVPSNPKAPIVTPPPRVTPPPSVTHPTLYHYVNPFTGQEFHSLLDPNHPEMVCLQKGHEPERHFGILGMLAAVIWFPFGIVLCCLDSRVRCQRCGIDIHDGLCGL